MHRALGLRIALSGVLSAMMLGALIACGASSTTPTEPSVVPSPGASSTQSESPGTTGSATETPASSARYELTFEASWSEETHPTDFPANPHFSGLIGAAHSPAVSLWEEGKPASAGMMSMAETGDKQALMDEIRSLIDAGDACTTISGGAVSPSPGLVKMTITVTQDCPAVSVVSMVAPSPDWFVGVSGLSLLEGDRWVEQVEVELLPFDAGTDSGASYTSPNMETQKPEGIRNIETPPLATGGKAEPLGTFTFTLLDG
jgi:hypothetical protein